MENLELPSRNVSNRSQATGQTYTNPNTVDTQRLLLDVDGMPVSRPPRQASTRPAPARRQRPASRKRGMSKKEKITLISLASITALLIIAVIIAASALFAPAEDDGLILKGVVAAGVNLGGMTPEEAKLALEEATANTYTKLDMSVTVLDTTIALSPQNTGARLDVDAVVQDAYNYGRTGSRTERQQAKNYALVNSVIIPISSHLNLNTDYIRTEINKLGSKFSTTLAQPTITITGTKPQMGVEKPDTSVVHQTLTVFVGTAEYGLDTNKLYEQVLEYYNINIFQVVGTCSVVAPESIESKLIAAHEELYQEPVDAQIDSNSSRVIPEVYGYGFDLDLVKMQIATAPYGTILEIPLTYLEPNLTAELISSNLFKDILGDFRVSLGDDIAWNNNVAIACEAFNGLILKSGEEFSFNNLLGLLSADKGYLEANTYIGQRLTPVIGGGVTQVASVLYNCVLEAELEILEHKHHFYAPTYIEVGRDAYVNIEEADFSFRNTFTDPIRIDAQIVNGELQIAILGTDNRNYTVEIATKILNTFFPGTLRNYMLSDNPGGYAQGHFLVKPSIGYDVELIATKRDKETNLLSEESLSSIHYEARDAVIVYLQNPTPDIPSTTVPSEPATQPSNVPFA